MIYTGQANARDNKTTGEGGGYYPYTLWLEYKLLHVADWSGQMYFRNTQDRATFKSTFIQAGYTEFKEGEAS